MATPFKVFTLDINRVKAAPEVVVEKIIQINSLWKPQVFGIETVAAQVVLLSFLEHVTKERNININVKELKPPRGFKKAEFIRGSLAPLFKAGQIYLMEGQHELIDELITHPYGDHDDCINALAYGPQVWNEPDEMEWSVDPTFVEEQNLQDRNVVTGY